MGKGINLSQSTANHLNNHNLAWDDTIQRERAVTTLCIYQMWVLVILSKLPP